MEATVTHKEQKNRTKGMLLSGFIHAVVLVLLMIPFITRTIPPPGQRGILVSLGLPDTGEGNDKPDTQREEVIPPKPPVEEQQAEEKKTEEPKVEKVVQKAKTKEVITTDTPEEIAIKKQKEQEAQRLRDEELKQQREAEEARLKAEEEARRKAEEEAQKQAELEKTKKQYSDLLGGSGKGQTGTAGNQGDPEGDPNATKLEGISSGSGMVGGGLGNRGVLYEPSISDDSQKIGKVVVKVCVDQTGDVISAQYTQLGSTTTDADLRALAIRSAREFRFTPSDVDKQCGTITIDFKVR